MFLLATVSDNSKKEKKKDESMIEDNSGEGKNKTRTPKKGGDGKKLFIAALIISLIGIGASIELTRVHHKAHKDIASSCDISEKVSCTSIALTEEAVFLRVPISVWGICTYLVFGVLAVWGMGLKDKKSFPWAICFLFGLATVIYSVWLGYIAYFKYGFVCLWCTALYVVNMALMICGILGVRKSGLGYGGAVKGEVSYLWGVRELTVPLVILGGLIAAGLIYFYPAHPDKKYAEKEVDFSDNIRVDKAGRKADGRAEKDGKGSARQRKEGSEDKRDENGVPIVGKHKLVDSATPVRGAENPDLILVEFSDYECPFCERAHLNVKKAFEKYKHRMKMYHRHFPLDQSCNRLVKRPYHRNACNAARASVCAGRQGKFWEMDHLLFTNKESHTGEALMELVTRVGLNEKEFRGCMESESSMEQVKKDIEVGLALKMRGTPTFVFYGPHLDRKMVSGLIKVKSFDNLFKALDRAKAKTGSETGTLSGSPADSEEGGEESDTAQSE